MYKPHVHFVSVFSVDYDHDLLYPWIEHYLKFSFDTYKIFFHTMRDSSEEGFRNSFLYLIKKRYGNLVNGEFIEGTPDFKCGNLRNQYIEKYKATLEQDDYMVTADSDEFQNLGCSYKEIILNHDCVCGKLVDRWGNTLCRLDDGLSPEQVYTNEGNFYASIGHRFASSDEMCFFGRSKIMAHRVSMPVNFLGSHILNGSTDGKIPDTYTQSSGHKVYHYSFRSTFIDRMYNRYYYTSDDVYQVLKAFDMVDSKWVERLRDRERKRQEEMGWLPASQEG
jgi:hypothetical protein